MSESFFCSGDFVWCAFPQSETLHRPGPRNLGYIVAVSSLAPPNGFSAIVAYTTSQPRATAAEPLGLFRFDRREAETFGQKRAFVLDPRRLAWVEVTPAWFPWPDQPGGGVQGPASSHWPRQFEQKAEEILTRHPSIVERLGPLWPRGR